ncbi:MAG: hypothetical protein WCS43_19190, partial [Verrucomicrobiota bacterium]
MTFTVRSTTVGTPVFTATDTSDAVILTQTAGVTFVASSAKDILTFGTNVTALAPTFRLSAIATASPASGTGRNFTTAQTYTITAQDGSTKDYTVTVTDAQITNGSVRLLTTINDLGASTSTRHYAVVWVTKADGTFIKTLWKQG